MQKQIVLEFGRHYNKRLYLQYTAVKMTFYAPLYNTCTQQFVTERCSCANAWKRQSHRSGRLSVSVCLDCGHMCSVPSEAESVGWHCLMYNDDGVKWHDVVYTYVYCSQFTEYFSGPT